VIVAIDGPAGSGKSTVAREAARRLGFTYLDSGALYRTIGLLALEQALDLADGVEVGRLAASVPIDVGGREDGSLKVLVRDRDVSEEIRAQSVAAASSRVAAHPEVRRALLEKQRAIIRAGDHVVEGRDIGTVVAPDAAVKLFLDAAPDERVRRRVAELTGRGQGVDANDVEAALAERDNRDMTRTAAPLKPAPDAVVIDTTGLAPEQVIERVVELVERAQDEGNGD
jgi:cytidylate kinase